MKPGIYFDLRNPGREAPWPKLYGEVLDVCAEAEALGAGSAWFSEHHGFDDGYLPQPLTFASAVAARTSTMRIGTAVVLATLRNAVQLAEEASVVDQLSGGRLDLGIGAGYRRAEFDLFGLPADTRPLERLFATYDDLTRALADDGITPGPAQRPLPVWLGCNGPSGARRAGLVGGRLLSLRRRIVDEYRRGLGEAGHDPASAVVSGPVNVFLAEDPERVRAGVRDAYRYLWDSYARHTQPDARALTPEDMDEAERRGLGGGTSGLVIARPEDAARLLASHFDGLPVDAIFTWARLPGVDRADMHRHLELWCGALPRLLESATDESRGPAAD